MASVVSNIPDDKLKELVEYYSRITPTRNNGKSLDQEPINFNPSLYEKGKASAGMCLGCHFATPSGGTANTTTPRIAGQQKDYIAAQLRAFKSGDRVNESMQIFARMIQEEDIDAIAYYFSVLPYEPPAAQ
jgi:cytochrome c553